VVGKGEVIAALTHTVKNIKTDKDCEFRIIAENKAGPGQPSGPSKAQKYEGEAAPSPFIKDLEDVTLDDVGLDATFQCEVSQVELKAEWFKADKPLKKSDKYETTSVKGKHTLIVKSCQSDDVAKYSVKLGSMQSAAKLDVKVPPRFGKDVSERTIKLKTGASSVIEVPFFASPQPNVTWTFNGGKLPDPKRFKTDSIVNMTSMTMAKVTKKDAGKYSLVLESELGRCELITTLVVIDKPGAPQDLEVTECTETSVTLSWAPPFDDGGSEIIKYVVEKRESSKRTYSPVGTPKETTISAQNLTAGQALVFHVAAENECGVGEFVELEKPVSPRSGVSAPGAPESVEATEVTKDSARIQWKEPSDDGGSPILGYFIERSLTSSSRWIKISKELVTELSYTASELVEDNEYVFRVTAENKVGPGPASEPTKPVLAKDPWQKPGKPDPPIIKSTAKKSVSLTWAPPTDDGGSPITSYEVEYKAEEQFKWIKANKETVSTTSYTVTGLTTDMTYEFRVAAVNKAGVGPASEPAKPAIAKEIVSGEAPKLLRELSDETVTSPANVTFECKMNLGEPQAEVKWFRDGKEIFKNKKYQMTAEGERVSLIITGSETLDAATYKCEASNKLGTVKTQCKLTVLGKPVITYEDKLKSPQRAKAGGNVTIIANIAGSPTPKVSWFLGDEPLSSGNGITIDTKETVSTVSIKGVSAKTVGQIKVVAENKAGTDEATFKVEVKDIPSPPLNLKIKEVTKDSVTLIWESPDSDGGAPITGYLVERKDVTKTAWVSAGRTDSNTCYTTVQKLIENNEYLFQVAAENEIGQSDWTATKNPVKVKLSFDPPGPPEDLKVKDLTKSSCTLVWSPPESDGGSPITGYHVEKLTGTRWIKATKKATTKCTYEVSDLVEGSTDNEYRVCAENAAGIGKPSETTGRFTAKDAFDVPGKPDAPNVEDITPDSASLTWEPPSSDGGSPITGYVVEMKAAGETKWKVAEKSVKETMFVVKGLKTGTDYEFRVMAENKAGPGQPSSPCKPVKYSDEIRFTRELQNVKLEELGVKVTLECELSKEGLKVEWMKDGKKLRRDDRYDITTDGRTQRLIIEKAAGEDAGKYSAVYEKLTTTANITLAVAPKIGEHKYSDKLILKAGTSAVIEIPFVGSPLPEAKWQFKGGKLPDPKRFKVDTIVNMTSISMAKVVRADGGKYSVDLKNEFGKASVTIEVVVLDKPSAPEDLAVKSMTDNSISLKWSEPSDNGGCLITGYVIEKREASKRTWQRDGSTTDVEFESVALSPGVGYSFQVAAENEVGVGPFVELTKAATPRSQFELPGAPSAPEVNDVTKESCVLTWTPPESDGGTEITGYLVERSTGQSARWIRVTKDPVPDATLTVTDLIEDNEYEFRVIAINKVGEGPCGPKSGIIKAKDPWEKPSKPDAPEIKKVAKTSVTLSWKPPSSDGGSAIFNYVVEYRLEGAFKWIKANEDKVPDTSYTVKGLKVDTVYEFRISAENRAGVGPASEPTSPVKAEEKVVGEGPELLKPLTDLVAIMPAEVTLECKIADGEPSVTVRWFKDNKEVYASKKHQLSYVNDVASLRMSVTEAKDTGKYRCEAGNKVGSVETDCTLSIHHAPIIDYTAFLKDTQTVKAGASLILLVNIVGIPTPSFKWFLGDEEITKTAPGVTIEGDGTFSRLTVKNSSAINSGKYRIVAENSVGTGSAEFNVVVKDKPSAPRNIRVVEQHKEYITVEWDAPEQDGGSEITKYIVEKADPNRKVYTTIGDTDSSTLRYKATKLYEGSEYLFQVSAENSIGQGPPCTMKESVTAKLSFEPPSPPRNVHVEDVTKTSCKITWEAPKSDGGSPIKGYYVEKSTARSTRFTKVNREPVSELSKSVKDLIEGTEYEFRVIAENDAGQSKPSETTGIFVAKEPFDAPGKPGTPVVSELTKSSATITWDAPNSDGGAPVTHYVVEMKENTDRWKVKDDKVKDKTLTLEGLREGSSYEFRVSAVNKVGPGQPSASSQAAKYSEELKFTKQLEDIKLEKVGAYAVFECELSKEGLKVDWYKDSKKIRADEDYEIQTDGRTHKLIIKKTTDKHIGTYKAEYQQLTTAAKLSLQVAPSIGEHEFRDKLVLKAGASAVIEIPFQASPAPTIEWKFNNGRLPDPKRFKEDTAVSLTSLSMGKVVKTDAGDYALTIQNALGKATFKIKLIIQDVPGQPKNFAVTSVSEKEIGLKWSEPDSDGGREITGYIVEMREASKRVWNRAGTTDAGDKMELLVKPLISGTQYMFRVAAENDTGVGEWAELSQSFTAKSTFAVPGAPSVPTVLEVFKESCSLSWRAPDSDGGSPVIGYHVERSTSGKTLRWIRITRDAVPDLTFKVTELVEGNEYQFRIIAENKAGLGPEGPASDPILAKDPWEKPGKPGVPEVKESTKTSVTLTWSPPEDDGGSEIFNYVVEYRQEGAFKWNRATEDKVPATTYTIKGLQESTEYDFRVAAENKA